MPQPQPSRSVLDLPTPSGWEAKLTRMVVYVLRCSTVNKIYSPVLYAYCTMAVVYLTVGENITIYVTVSMHLLHCRHNAIIV